MNAMAASKQQVEEDMTRLVKKVHLLSLYFCFVFDFVSLGLLSFIRLFA